MKSKTSFFAIKVAVSPSQPSFTSYNASFSRKHVSSPALEQNETWHAIFTMNHVAEMAPDPNMLMFGDKAVRDIFMLFCKDGRSLKGSRCVQKKHFLCGPCYLIVPFITLDGIITYEIIEGPVSGECFYLLPARIHCKLLLLYGTD